MHASKKTGCWRLACSLALVVSLTVSAGADEEPGGGLRSGSNSTEVMESSESGSRSLRGFPVPRDYEDFPWFMPIFGVEMCSKLDGYLCGIGIRVGTKAYFLAAVASVSRVVDMLNEKKEDAGPGVFGIDRMRPEIDISKRNNGDGSYWAPEFKKMVNHNIGLYQIYVRKLGYFLMPEGGYPNEVSAPLQTKKGEIKDDCRLVSYGENNFGNRGIDEPIRYRNYVPVKRIECKDYLCYMETERRRDKRGNAGGYLCSIYSELGAPIVCGWGPSKTVDYIVTEVEIIPKSNCTYDFKALEVSGYGQEIIDQVAEWEKSDKNLNKHRPLRFGR
jgi:hypothetical protein